MRELIKTDSVDGVVVDFVTLNITIATEKEEDEEGPPIKYYYKGKTN